MADPFTGEIRIFGFTFAPANWAFCVGTALPVQQYSELFAVIGFNYGGNTANSMFKLPNLQGTAVAGSGQGTNLSIRDVGDTWGDTYIALAPSEMPKHQHALNGVTASSVSVLVNEPTSTSHLARTFGQINYSSQNQPNATMSFQTLGATGSGMPHENRQPYLVMNFCICLYGNFPVKGS